MNSVFRNIKNSALSVLQSNIQIVNTVFQDNQAPSTGGAIQIDFTSTLNLTSCTFTGNSAVTFGGAVYTLHGSTTTVFNCSFTGNVGGGGGAIFSVQICRNCELLLTQYRLAT